MAGQAEKYTTYVEFSKNLRPKARDVVLHGKTTWGSLLATSKLTSPEDTLAKRVLALAGKLGLQLERGNAHDKMLQLCNKVNVSMDTIFAAKTTPVVSTGGGGTTTVPTSAPAPAPVPGSAPVVVNTTQAAILRAQQEITRGGDKNGPQTSPDGTTPASDASSKRTTDEQPPLMTSSEEAAKLAAAKQAAEAAERERLSREREAAEKAAAAATSERIPDADADGERKEEEDVQRAKLRSLLESNASVEQLRAVLATAGQASDPSTPRAQPVTQAIARDKTTTARNAAGKPKRVMGAEPHRRQSTLTPEAAIAADASVVEVDESEQEEGEISNSEHDRANPPIPRRKTGTKPVNKRASSTPAKAKPAPQKRAKQSQEADDGTDGHASDDSDADDDPITDSEDFPMPQSKKEEHKVRNSV